MRAGWLRSGLGALALLSLAAAGTAATGGELVAELTAYRVVKTADGGERLEPAERIWPGELVEYRAEYRNRGDGALSQVQPLLPVPAGLEYVPESAAPAAVQASTDGEHFAPVPLRRTVRGPDGREVTELVPPGEYRALKWDVGALGAGESRQVRARMRVLPVTPPVSASATDEAR